MEMTLSPPPSASTLPVVFFDGERNFHAGVIAVSGSTDINSFLSGVSRLIGGASPRDISTSLVRRNKIPRMIAIDDSSSFKDIARERDCFVVATTRHRPPRRRGKKGWPPSPEKMAILNRNQETPPPAVGVWDYQSRIRNFDLMRERFLMSTSSAAAMNYYAPSHRASWPATDGGFRYSPAVTSLPPKTPSSPLAKCEECLSAMRERRSPEFHLCVNDRAVAAFRTSVGPIERPVKKQEEASG